MQSLIMKMLPDSAQWFLRLLKRSPRVLLEFIKDSVDYLRHSCTLDYFNDKEKLFSLITATYHNIEKGLSLTKPRPGFGKPNIMRLIHYINEYQSLYGYASRLDTPINVLNEYHQFNVKNDTNVEWLEAHLEKLNHDKNSHLQSSGNQGGVVNRSKGEITNIVANVPEDFFYLRHSIRQFTDVPVSLDVMHTAVRIAQKSPVVCNRQSGKVYAILNKEKIVKTLELQGGARGFLNEVAALFCITVDTRNFNGSGERNQGWIDGGMYAMSFVLGLHQQGLGACCLNWSKTVSQSDMMKQHLNLPESERIIMFVAAGHLKDQFNVAESVRKPLDTVFKVVG